MINLYYIILTSFLISYSGLSAHWAHEHAKMPAHSNVNYNRMENGFSYAWHKKPSLSYGETKCQIYLHVEAGSLHEEEHEHGIAHFLEHIAFKGGKKFPAGEMVKAMQRLGLSFGAHLNAHTSFNETVYKFDLEKSCVKEDIETILLALREIADGLLINEADVQAEKGVIDAEERIRAMPSYQEDWILTRHMPELTNKKPMGSKSIRDQFNAHLVRQFYQKWYQPQRMKLLIIGGTDDLESSITALVPTIFSTMVRGSNEISKSIQALPIEPICEILPITQIPLSVGQSYCCQTASLKPRDLNEMVMQEKREVLIRLLQKRIDPYKSSSLQTQLTQMDQYYFGSPCLPILAIGFVFQQPPGNYAQSFALWENIVEVALEKGFSDQEFAQALSTRIEEIKKASVGEIGLTMEDLLGDARGFCSSLSAEQKQAFILPALENFSKEEARAILAEMLKATPLLCAMGQVLPQSKEEFLGQITKERRSLVEKKGLEDQIVPYAFPAAEIGAEVLSIDNSQPGRTMVKFANGVELLKVDSPLRIAGKFQVTIGIKNPSKIKGRKDKVIAHIAGQRMSSLFGIADHSVKDLRRMFSDEFFNFHMFLDEDEKKSLLSTPGEQKGRDLLKQLELLMGYFLNPTIKEDMLSCLQGHLKFQASQSKDRCFHEFRLRVFGDEVDCLRCCPSSQEIASFSKEEMISLINPLLKDSPLEIDFYGSESVEEVISAVAKTFGMLPLRNEILLSNDSPSTNTQFSFQSGLSMNFQSPDVQNAQLLMYFPLSGVSEINSPSDTVRALRVMNIIAQDRVLKVVREINSGSYTPRSEIEVNGDNFQSGTLKFWIDLDPNRTDFLLEKILTSIELLAQKGPFQEELDRARAQILYPSDFEKCLTIEQLRTLGQQVLRQGIVSYALLRPYVL